MFMFQLKTNHCPKPTQRNHNMVYTETQQTVCLTDQSRYSDNTKCLFHSVSQHKVILFVVLNHTKDHVKYFIFLFLSAHITDKAYL